MQAMIVNRSIRNMNVAVVATNQMAEMNAKSNHPRFWEQHLIFQDENHQSHKLCRYWTRWMGVFAMLSSRC